MSVTEKLQYRKVKAVVRYHKTNPHKNIEQYAYHLLLDFIHFAIFQEPGATDIIIRNMPVIKPYSSMVEQTF